MASLKQRLFSGGDTTLRQGLMGNVVALVVVVAGVIGSVLLVGSYWAISDVSERAIEQAGDSLEAQVSGMFGPIENKGEIIRDWGESGELVLHHDEIVTLNTRLRPVVERDDHMMAVALADSEGREYVAWKEGENWVSRYSYADSDEEQNSLWQRWDQNGDLRESWSAEREEDTRTRPWYVGAVSSEQDGPYWTEPFNFFMSDEPGITLSRAYKEPVDDRTHVLSLGVSLEDISHFTTEMRPTESGFSAVMTGAGQVVGLPARTRYETSNSMHADILSSWDELNLESLGEGWEQWRDAEEQAHSVTGRAEELGRYRAGFRRFELGDRHLVLATVIPRSDLTGVVDQQRNLTIVLSLLALLLAVFVAKRTSKRYRKRMAEAFDEAEQLGQYRLEEKLGVGGMGEVYRAEHGMLKRPTAVKLLKPDLYDKSSIKRFEREVKLSCQLTHPNTVTIFDYGRTDDGLFYYAMELLDGVTLRDFVSYTGPLPEGRVIYLLRQICGALIEAHEIGLIHRDIKPDNIMVGSTGGWADRITVLDFGLVKDIAAPDDTRLTNQDYLHGSPGYMAPEVILGESGNDPRVDIYAVGAVGYTLLCGEDPFSGESTVKILMAQVEEDPPRPSEVLDREVDSELEELIMQCLSQRPEDRPASMVEFQELLLKSTAGTSWKIREALDWWTEYGDAVVPTTESPITEHSSQAYGMTLSIQARRKESMTLDAEPDDLVGLPATEEEGEAEAGEEV